MTATTDYVLEDRTRVKWPGALPYRTRSSARGYATAEDAARRARAVERHYNAHYGCGPGDLRVIERVRTTP